MGPPRSCSTDDDVACCMENVHVHELGSAACTSLSCMARDLGTATDLDAAKAAVLKHDRYMYLMLAIVGVVVLYAVLCRRQPAPVWRRYPRFGPYV